MKARYSIALVLGLGLFGMGCGGGGGGGGGASVSGISPVATGILPTPQRDPLGYVWENFYQANLTAGGYVVGLGTAANSTATIVAHAPLGRIDSVDNGLNKAEASLVFDATSIVSVGTATYAATGNDNAARAGGVYVRDNGRWSLIVDLPHSSSVVATLGSDVYAFSGEYGGRPAVVSALMSGTSGQFITDIAILGSCCPTAAVGFQGEMWVGAASDSLQGGPVKFYRGSGVSWSQIDGPSVGGFGREKVTSMININDQALVMALGTFDVATGNAAGGAVILSDGRGFEIMTSFSGEAPTSLTVSDATIYVGTSKGRLLYRDVDGSWKVETGMPATTSVRSLLGPTAAELFVGVRGSRGALVLRRVARGGGIPLPTSTTTPTTPTTPVTPVTPVTPTAPATDSYLGSVKVLMQTCNSCHRAGGTAGTSGFVLSNNLSLDMQDFNEIKTMTNTTTPAQSRLLLKATGDASVGHGGGSLWTVGDAANYNKVVTWIQNGQKFN